MYKHIKVTVAGGLAALVAAGVLAATPAYAAGPRGGQGQGGRGQGPVATETVTTQLSDSEKADLAFGREEERMAMDLYKALYKQHRVDIFSNIANSESKHFAALGNMLTRYGVEDLSAKSKPGVYANPELQALYNDWYARGMASKEAAFQVGIELEKRDIADLDKMMAGTENVDLDRVYGNLKRGSENHLRAFTAAASGATTGDGTCTGGGQGGGQGGSGMGGGKQMRRGR